MTCDDTDLKWTDPDEENLVEFMVKEKGFNEDRIRNGIKKLMKSKKQSTQVRITVALCQPSLDRYYHKKGGINFVVIEPSTP